MSKQVVGTNVSVLAKTFLTKDDTLCYLSSAIGVENSLITDLIQQSTQNWIYYRPSLKAMPKSMLNAFPKNLIQTNDDASHELLVRLNYVFIIECRVLTFVDEAGALICGLFPDFGLDRIGLNDLTSVDMYSCPIYLVVDPLGMLFNSGDERLGDYYALNDEQLEQLFRSDSFVYTGDHDARVLHRQAGCLELYRRIVEANVRTIDMTIAGATVAVDVANVALHPIKVYSRVIPETMLSNMIKYESNFIMRSYAEEIGVYGSDGEGPFSGNLNTSNYRVTNFVDYMHDHARTVDTVISGNIIHHNDVLSRMFYHRTNDEQGFLPPFDIQFRLYNAIYEPRYYSYSRYLTNQGPVYGHIEILGEYPLTGSNYNFSAAEVVYPYDPIDVVSFPLVHLNGPIRLGKPYDLSKIGRNYDGFRNLNQLISLDTYWNYAKDYNVNSESVNNAAYSSVVAEVTDKSAVTSAASESSDAAESK